MKEILKVSPYTLPVLLAGGILILLAATLGERILGRHEVRPLAEGLAPLGPADFRALDPSQLGEAPPSRVLEPRPLDLSTLEIPCWSCVEARSWKIESRVDLDLIAPLGDGSGNAGEWIAARLNPGNGDSEEWAAALGRLVAGSGVLSGKMVLPPEDPFLRAAEPWMDQAELRLYPDFLAFRGGATELPNFLALLCLARSWIARGKTAATPEAALEDFRRVVRLGRLLRQEDVTVIADLVGIAVLRLGLEAVYDEARGAQDARMALVSAAALSELAPQRYLTSDRTHRLDLTKSARRYGTELQVSNSVVRELSKVAEKGPERRFRIEAIFQLVFVARFGLDAQKREALTLLTDLKSDPDPLVAYQAAWVLALDPVRLREAVESFS